MLRATLTFVRRGEALVTATSLAVLDAPDQDFLARHVARLREVTAAEDALLSRFQHRSALPKLLDDLRGADDKQFVDISAGLATRLHDSMEQSTKPGPGVLAIMISGPDGKDPDVTSILKLDAIPELARYLVKAGQVRLNIVRDLLPAPGALQKGISVPDERGTSEAIVIDRNPSAARYFFNAYELGARFHARSVNLINYADRRRKRNPAWEPPGGHRTGGCPTPTEGEYEPCEVATPKKDHSIRLELPR